MLLVEDPKQSQEHDIKMVNVLKINMYLFCRFRVLVLGGVMILACSTLEMKLSLSLQLELESRDWNWEVWEMKETKTLVCLRSRQLDETNNKFLLVIFGPQILSRYMGPYMIDIRVYVIY